MRFQNIQLLRLATAVGVVLAHAGYYGGYLFGVTGPLEALLWSGTTWKGLLAPTFFAISGFVLTQAIHSAPPGRFLFARALRVYPGYWLTALLVMGLMWFTVWPPAFRQYVYPGNIGWTLLPRGPAACIYPLGVEWTLVYEMVLYLWMTAVALLFGVRRGLPVAAGVWLGLLVVKGFAWPGYGSAVLPTCKTVWCSAANVGFLLGVLAYYLRGTGRRWRWVVFAGLVVYVVLVPGRFHTLEGQWFATGPAAAVLVWFVVQLRQAAATNPLVRAGEYTYGLYLLHTPVLMGTFYLLLARGWLLGSAAGVLVAGAAAVTLGLLYGRAEFRLSARLRPLTKVKLGGAWAPTRWIARVRTRATPPA